MIDSTIAEAEMSVTEPAEAHDLIAKIWTPAQIAEAQRLAREWMAKFGARNKKQ